MPLDTRLGRWIKQSIYHALTDNIDTSIWPIFYEGQTRNTRINPTWIEIRVDGPFVFHRTKRQWRVESEVNILLSDTVGDDIYTLDKMGGQVIEILSQQILVKQYADGEAEVGCMVPKSGIRNGIRQSHFGNIGTDENLYQSTVEAHYELHLTI